jgi:hypothetical protein
MLSVAVIPFPPLIWYVHVPAATGVNVNAVFPADATVTMPLHVVVAAVKAPFV